MATLHTGDRVTFIRRSPHHDHGWPYRRSGVVVAEPHLGVFYVRVDGCPGSLVPVTEAMGLVGLEHAS